MSKSDIQPSQLDSYEIQLWNQLAMQFYFRRIHDGYSNERLEKIAKKSVEDAFIFAKTLHKTKEKILLAASLEKLLPEIPTEE